jgi:hypothetical protein
MLSCGRGSRSASVVVVRADPAVEFGRDPAGCGEQLQLQIRLEARRYEGHDVITGRTAKPGEKPWDIRGTNRSAPFVLHRIGLKRFDVRSYFLSRPDEIS